VHVQIFLQCSLELPDVGGRLGPGDEQLDYRGWWCLLCIGDEAVGSVWHHHHPGWCRLGVQVCLCAWVG
jgi:hypothetical protein